MGPQGYDFDERLSQNEIHEVGVSLSAIDRQ